MNVLVPLDGSDLSDSILAHVQNARRDEEGEVHLLRVLDDADQEEAALAHLEECKAQLEACGLTVKTKVAQGRPDEQILQTLEAGDYELVCMATHGRSGVDRWIRGSVAERVLRGAPTPVFLANPQSISLPSVERILVPMDGSRFAAKALALAGPLARKAGAEVVLLYVDVPGGGSVHPVAEIAMGRAQERAESTLHAAKDKLAGKEIPFRVVGRYGDPAVQIMETIEVEKIDLVAMSSHGRTGVSRWRFGSVAEKVLRQCRAPVLVWRPRR
jgi:nucleotide-binding universal stress UspA family protein